MIEIASVSARHVERYVELHNGARESDISAAELTASDARAAENGFPRFRWMCSWKGRPSGAAALLASPYNPADEPDVEIVVAPPAQGNGIGTALLAHVSKHALANSASALRCNVKASDTHSISWAERRGSEPIFHRFESVLEVSAFDAESHQRRKQRAKQAGFSFRSMDGLNTEQGWTALQNLFLNLLPDAPDMKGLPGWTEAQARSVLRDNPKSRPEWQFVALDGNGLWQGLTVLTKLGSRGYIFFTGINRAVRGLGLAVVLQGEAVLRARPDGLRLVFLNNLSTNLPMIAVNQRLGFQPRPGFQILRKRLSHNG
jgi:GNAT superfamily N-acetyltransferase